MCRKACNTQYPTLQLREKFARQTLQQMRLNSQAPAHERLEKDDNLRSSEIFREQSVDEYEDDCEFR